MILFALSVGKFSDGGCTWTEPDNLGGLGLTVGEFSDGSCT